MSAPAKKGRSRKATSTPQPKPVRFALEDAGALTVCVAGSFNQWNPEATPLSAAEPGRWQAEVALAPGRYEYLFVVDGQWRADPGCGQVAPNPFGGVNCVLEVA